MSALKITLEVCLATLLIVLLAMLTWVALNLAADYLRMPLAQVIAGTGLVLTAGVGSFAVVDHVRTHNKRVLEQARVHNEPRRSIAPRPAVPPVTPPRGPRV